jgi:hypothetical protein
MQAKKWVNGIEQPLSTGVTVLSSVASYVTDSGVIFGNAALSDGSILLIRWGTSGQAQILYPPAGFKAVYLTSIKSLGVCTWRISRLLLA